VAAARIAAFISGRGDAMHDTGNVKILFIAGFGPIVRDVAESRKLYREALGIPFKEETDGYLHTEALRGAKSFALWPLSQAAQSCFGIPGLITFLHHKRGSSVTLTASKRQRRILNRVGIECLSRTRKNPGAKPLVGSSHPRDYWSA
jgi:hypothetical protein